MPIVPKGFSRTIWWLSTAIWFLQNTNALHAWIDDFQLNSTPQNCTTFLIDTSLYFSIWLLQSACTTYSKMGNLQNLARFPFRCHTAVTYTAHSKFQRSPSGTGASHLCMCHHSCTWHCTIALQQSPCTETTKLGKNMTQRSKCG